MSGQGASRAPLHGPVPRLAGAPPATKAWSPHYEAMERALSPEDRTRLLPDCPEFVFGVLDPVLQRTIKGGLLDALTGAAEPVVVADASVHAPLVLEWGDPTPPEPLSGFFHLALEQALRGARTRDAHVSGQAHVELVVGAVALVRHWGGQRVGYLCPSFLVGSDTLNIVLTPWVEPARVRQQLARILLLLFEAAGDVGVYTPTPALGREVQP